MRQLFGLAVPPGEAGGQAPVDQHPPALQRVAARLRDGGQLLDVGRRQAERAGLEAVGHQPLVRAEAQVLVSQAGSDVEHGASGRQPLIQEVRAAQRELPGDQGRAQGFGIIRLLAEFHGGQAGTPALVPAIRLPVRRDSPAGGEPGPLPWREPGMTKRAVQQRDKPVVGRHLGDRVARRQGARGQRRPVPGPGGLVGSRSKCALASFDLPGEQQAPAEPHFQARVHAVPPLGERDRGPPPCRRVFPGQQSIGGIGGRRAASAAVSSLTPGRPRTA